METKKPTILIVDDNPNNLKVLAGVLKGEGYDFRMAKSGHSALSILEKMHPDLILLDIQMPEMDGFETCEKIKKIEANKNIPVVYLTANTDTDSIEKAFHSGGVDYITKPFNSNELLARIKTHIKLKRQSEELELQNATKDKFVSIISHDLIGPIGGIIGFSKILREDVKEMEAEKIELYSSIIHNSATFTLELLKNLLEWSRSQIGSMTPVKNSFSINDLLVKNIQGHITQSSAKEIEIIQDFNEDLLVYADKKMISAVVRNLISNGIKFTPKGGTITIVTKESMRNDKHVIETEIKDTGVGIPNEKIKDLFKLESNYKSTGTNNEKGTGLGLILCEEFLSMNDGFIRVESEPGKGSSFIFSLEAAT